MLFRENLLQSFFFFFNNYLFKNYSFFFNYQFDITDFHVFCLKNSKSSCKAFLGSSSALKKQDGHMRVHAGATRLGEASSTADGSWH